MTFYLEDLLGIELGEKMFRKLFNVGKGIEQAGEFIGKDPKVSRRDVFKLGAIAGGTALGLGALGAREVRAEENIIPPGIEISKKYDINTYHAFIDYKMGRNIEAIRRLRLVNENTNPNTSTMIINSATPSIDPGYHVVAALVWSNMINNNLTKKAGGNVMFNHVNVIDKIKDKNMRNFAFAIYNCMWKWNVSQDGKYNISFNQNLHLDIEKPFLSAIFGSAGINTNQHNTLRNQRLNQMGYKSNYPIQQTDLDELAQFYMNLPDNRYKKLILDETIENLQKLNKNSKEILIAAWSSFWLTNYYWISAKNEGDENHKLMKLTNTIIEKPLNKLGIKIRGAPYYFEQRI